MSAWSTGGGEIVGAAAHDDRVVIVGRGGTYQVLDSGGSEIRSGVLSRGASPARLTPEVAADAHGFSVADVTGRIHEVDWDGPDEPRSWAAVRQHRWGWRRGPAPSVWAVSRSGTGQTMIAGSRGLLGVRNADGSWIHPPKSAHSTGGGWIDWGRREVFFLTDTSVRIWSMDTAKSWILDGSPKASLSDVFGGDARRSILVYRGSGSLVRVLDYSSGVSFLDLPSPSIESLALETEGSRLFGLTQDGGLVVWQGSRFEDRQEVPCREGGMRLAAAASGVFVVGSGGVEYVP